MSSAGNMDEVIAALDGIIATAIAERRRIGFFAALESDDVPAIIEALNAIVA